MKPVSVLTFIGSTYHQPDYEETEHGHNAVFPYTPVLVEEVKLINHSTNDFIHVKILSFTCKPQQCGSQNKCTIQLVLLSNERQC